MPVRLDFEMVSGDYRRLAVAVANEDGVPLDLTGATDIIWAVGQTVEGPRLVEKRKSSGGIILGAPGTFIVLLGTDELVVPYDSRLRCQAWVTFGSNTTSVGTGEITVMANVNRA